MSRALRTAAACCGLLLVTIFFANAPQSRTGGLEMDPPHASDLGPERNAGSRGAVQPPEEAVSHRSALGSSSIRSSFTWLRTTAQVLTRGSSLAGAFPIHGAHQQLHPAGASGLPVTTGSAQGAWWVPIGADWIAAPGEGLPSAPPESSRGANPVSVRGAEGHPLSDVELCAWILLDLPGGRTLLPVQLEGRTDEDGSWWLPALSGEVSLTATRGTRSAKWQGTLHAGGTTPIQLELHDRFDVEVSVRDEFGRPLQGARVRLQRAGYPLSLGDVEGRTNEDGLWVGDSAGWSGGARLGVVTEAKGYRASTTLVPVPAPGERASLQVRLERGLSLDLHAEALGQCRPVDRAGVLCWWIEPDAGVRTVLRGVTDDSGDHRFEGLPPGEVTLALDDLEWAATEMRTMVDAEAITEVWLLGQAAATLTGRVTLDGVPVPTALLRWIDPWGHDTLTRLRPGPEGRFRFTRLPAGSVGLLAYGPRMDELSAGIELTLQPGEVRELDLELHDPITVQGSVLDAHSGLPVQGALVVSNAQVGGAWVPAILPSEEATDREGRFTGLEVAPLAGMVTAYAEGYQASSSVIALDPDADDAVLEPLLLLPVDELELQLEPVPPNPEEWALMGDGAHFTSSGSLRLPAAQGRFQVEVAPPGAPPVVIQALLEGSGPWNLQVPTSVEQGRVVRFELVDEGGVPVESTDRQRTVLRIQDMDSSGTVRTRHALPDQSGSPIVSVHGLERCVASVSWLVGDRTLALQAIDLRDAGDLRPRVVIPSQERMVRLTNAAGTGLPSAEAWTLPRGSDIPIHGWSDSDGLLPVPTSESNIFLVNEELDLLTRAQVPRSTPSEAAPPTVEAMEDREVRLRVLHRGEGLGGVVAHCSLGQAPVIAGLSKVSNHEGHFDVLRVCKGDLRVRLDHPALWKPSAEVIRSGPVISVHVHLWSSARLSIRSETGSSARQEVILRHLELDAETWPARQQVLLPGTPHLDLDHVPDGPYRVTITGPGGSVTREVRLEPGNNGAIEVRIP